MLDYSPLFLSLLPPVLAPPHLFILLYPLNVWFLEVIEELYLIRPIYGRNVAWIYEDYNDEYLEGCVRLGHAPAWWALGSAIYLFLPTIKEAIGALV
jgi:hypothetical protein